MLLKKPQKVNFARLLRRNQSDAEAKIWINLQNRRLDGVKFRRQRTLGDYIVDFVSFEHKLIIEIDGGQHNELPIKEHDEQRTKWLESKGFKVLRFWNNDVLENTDGVLLKIKGAIGMDHTLTWPLPSRERQRPFGLTTINLFY